MSKIILLSKKQSEQLLYEIINHHHFHHTLTHLWKTDLFEGDPIMDSNRKVHHHCIISENYIKLNTSNPKYRKLLFHQLFLQNLKSYANWFYGGCFIIDFHLWV